MLKEKAIEMIIGYFQENEDDFIAVIEVLDSWNGYLGNDRYYNMRDLNDICFYSGTEATEILTRAFYGHDDETWHTNIHGVKEYGKFNPNRKYFFYNSSGNMVSADKKDYKNKLDKRFVNALIDNVVHLEIPKEVLEIIYSIEE